jgi:hypothetical protein
MQALSLRSLAVPGGAGQRQSWKELEMAADFWTSERLLLLKKLHKQGYSYGEIADKLGAGRGQVSSKIARLGLAQAKIPEWQRMVILETAKAHRNASMRELCEATAQPPKIVFSVLRRSRLWTQRKSCSCDKARVSSLREFITAEFC